MPLLREKETPLYVFRNSPEEGALLPSFEGYKTN
jgi:hypothetical protein